MAAPSIDLAVFLAVSNAGGFRSEAKHLGRSPLTAKMMRKYKDRG
jgi:hypothetical protein